MAERKLIYADELDAEMQKAQESLESNSDHVWGLNKGHHAGLAWARRLCADAQAVDATPVVHARWKADKYFDEPVMRCTACKCGFAAGHKAERFKHCPNCGAKMNGGADDENG